MLLMSTVVFFSIPAVGHVHPKLPIAAELVRRGERVVFYCGAPMRAQIEATGAEFRDIGLTLDMVQGQQPSILMIMLEQSRFCEAKLDGLIRDMEALAPDYILNDFMCVWGRETSRIARIPLVTMSSTFALIPDMMPSWPIMMALDIAAKPQIVQLLPELYAIGDRLSAKYKMRPIRSLFDMVSMQGEYVIVATSRAFQPRDHEFDARFHFVGPCFETRTGEHSSGLPPLDDRPLVYVSLGTVFNQDRAFFERCIEAFSDGRYQVLMSVGKNADALASVSKPEHIHALPYVPQLEVLKRASLFITHGGMNSTTESICHEVPMLVSPRGADQFLVAKRIEELGVGRTISWWHKSPKRLRALADSVVGDVHVRERLKALCKSFDGAGGVTRTVNLLQSIARKKQSVQVASEAV